MDINKLKADLLEKAINHIAGSTKDFCRCDGIKLLSDEEVQFLADGIEIKQCERVFVESSSAETYTENVIQVNDAMEVMCYKLVFNSGANKKRKDILNKLKDELKIGSVKYLFCGGSAWNWTRMMEDQGQILKDGKVVQDVKKAHLEEKEMDLARRSVTTVINSILIRLYERLIALYPDNEEIYKALCNVFEFNCKFLDRIKVLETMFERFGGSVNAMELCVAYSDNGIFEKSKALSVRIKSGEFKNLTE